MSAFAGIRHFTPAEFTEPDKMEPGLLVGLDLARMKAGVPILISSSYRPGDPKSHGRGWAVDISDNLDGEPIGSAWRFAVVAALVASNFRRIGIYDRHIHCDMDPALPAPVMWWGTSS